MKFESIQAPSAVVEVQRAVQRLDGRAADGQPIDTDRNLARHRRARPRDECLGKALKINKRRLVRDVGRGERTIDIHCSA